MVRGRWPRSLNLHSNGSVLFSISSCDSGGPVSVREEASVEEIANEKENAGSWNRIHVQGY